MSMDDDNKPRSKNRMPFPTPNGILCSESKINNQRHLCVDNLAKGPVTPKTPIVGSYWNQTHKARGLKPNSLTSTQQHLAETIRQKCYVKKMHSTRVFKRR